MASHRETSPHAIVRVKFTFHKSNVFYGTGAFVNEKCEEHPLKEGDFALVNPDEKHHYRNNGYKSCKMICWVPKEFK